MQNLSRTPISIKYNYSGPKWKVWSADFSIHGSTNIKHVPPPLLWWSVNLSDNWAFNIWTVNLIKTPTIINTQVNCNMVCLFWESMYILWLAEAFTTTHTPCDSTNHGHFTPSYLIYMWISVRQDILCSIVGELASSPVAGTPPQNL